MHAHAGVAGAADLPPATFGRRYFREKALDSWSSLPSAHPPGASHDEAQVQWEEGKEGVGEWGVTWRHKDGREASKGCFRRRLRK